MKNVSIRLLISFLNKISTLSWKSMYRISDVLRWVVFDVIKYRRDVIYTNLQRSFPEKSAKELAKIESDFHRNLTDIIVESLKTKTVSREEVNERFSCDYQILEDYYQKGQNIVFVLGHLGNWELANLFASANFSHRIVVVYHPLSSKPFNDYFSEIRSRFGSELIPMKEAYNRAPIPGERPFAYFLVNDQSPNPKKAYWTRFLNQDTGMFRGVEIIARRFNSPVLYAEIGRDETKRGHYKVNIEVITDNPAELPENAILEKQARLLEADIRKQPANWLWSHKRWKHPRPAHLEPFQLLEPTSPRDQTR